MRFLQVFLSLLFVIMSGLFLFFFIEERRNIDNTIPLISVPEGELKIKCDAEPEKLLENVTAFDEKDGDLTDKLIVESVSRFTEKGTCVVTYAVCDSDHHVTTAKRTVTYKDYKSPKFKLKKNPVFSAQGNIRLREYLTVSDKLDGDLTDSIILTVEDYEKGSTGLFYSVAQVTNSKGDTVRLRLPFIVEDIPDDALRVHLKSYLTYVKKGKSVSFKDNLDKVEAADGAAVQSETQIQTEFDADKVGTYLVHYYATDRAGHKGHAVQIVVVEG